MERTEKKKSLGRQKIEIKKIEKKNNLQVTFSKRRKGLVKKAGELSILCGVDVAVIVQSPAGKIHAFSNIPVESIMDRYLQRNCNTLLNMNLRSNDAGTQVQDHNEKKCMEIMRKLEAEKNVEKALEKSKASTAAKGHWWDRAFDNLDLNELEQYMDAMEALKNNVMNRADEKAKANDIVLMPNVTIDCFGGVPVPHTDFNSSTSKPLMLFNPSPSS